jgi:hypothetical protein
MDCFVVYICLAAIAALFLPMRAPRETFKIEVEPGVQWSNVVSTCKKPFTYLSNGVKNKIYLPTKEGIARAVPFKPYFRKRKRNKGVARMESMKKRQEKDLIAGRREGIGKYRDRHAKPDAGK